MMRVTQFANTLAVSDGGPARNAFELNISTNLRGDMRNQLFFFRGAIGDSVISGYSGSAGALPTPGPLKIGPRSVPTKRLCGYVDVYRQLKDSDVAIIHGYYLPWVPVVAAILRILRIPFVVTPHGSLTRHQQGSSRLKKRFYDETVGRAVRHWAALFVTGSRLEAEELCDKFPKLQALVGGVGTAIPQEPAEQRPWSAPLRLLSLSRIAPKKRIDLTIGAVRQLLDRGIECTLDVAGTGADELERSLRKLRDQLGLEEHVNFLGQRSGPEKAALFRQADIYVLPSDDENFGISLAEALAHGLPAVASDAVAASSCMDYTAGRVLHRPTAESIAEAISEMVSHDRVRYAMGAERVARDNYSWAVVADQWAEALCVARGQRAPIAVRDR